MIVDNGSTDATRRARRTSSRSEHDWIRASRSSSGGCAGSRRPGRARVHGRAGRARRRAAGRRRQARRRRRRSSRRLLRAPARRVRRRARDSASRAASATSWRTASGARASARARTSGAPRAPTGASASTTCCRSRSDRAGTRSTRSRRSCAAGDGGTLFDLPFKPPPAEGGARRRPLASGSPRASTAHYMGYRPSYLVARTAYRLRREPQAALMLWGFAVAALRRQPRLADERVRAHLRDLQRVRSMRVRFRETRGHI